MPNQPRSYSSIEFPEYLNGGIPNSSDLWQGSPISKAYTYENVLLKSGLTTILEKPDKREFFSTAMSLACRDMIGIPVVAVDHPGGSDRTACRLHLKNGQSVIASRRTDPGRAKLEERVMYHLSSKNAPIARTIAFNGLVLLQEDLGDLRLSSALSRATELQYEELMHNALNSLIKIQDIAQQKNLKQYVPIIGDTHDWTVAFIDQIARIGNELNIPAPPPDVDNIYDILTLYSPQFIKWDARPGNAIVDQKNQVYWFDWEHSGARNKVDDLVWLLCDESVPLYPDTEERLLHKFIPQFCNKDALEMTQRYTRIFGVLHSAARLGLILSHKKKQPWWNPEYILKTDRVGVTLEAAQRLCYRAARWSKEEPMIEVLSDWFLDVAKKLETI